MCGYDHLFPLVLAIQSDAYNFYYFISFCFLSRWKHTVDLKQNYVFPLVCYVLNCSPMILLASFNIGKCIVLLLRSWPRTSSIRVTRVLITNAESQACWIRMCSFNEPPLIYSGKGSSLLSWVSMTFNVYCKITCPRFFSILYFCDYIRNRIFLFTRSLNGI